jgi:hypothetical protein
MKMRFLREGVLLLSLLIGLTQAQTRYPVVIEDEKVHLGPVGFQYEIFFNEAFHFGNPELGTRNIGVLIEEKDFSEENLREIFRTLSKGYAKPPMLHIELVTNREQIYPAKWPRTSNEPEPSGFHQYHWARYFRSEGDDTEYFRYNVSPPSSDLKTIMLRGFDPAVRQRK